MRDLLFSICLCCILSANAQQATVEVRGAMRNVMWKGELGATIQTDTITGKKGLYGLGPMAFLKGELLLMDGVTYRSSVIDSQRMRVEKVADAGAPFFVYTHQANWKMMELPDIVTNLAALEKYLDRIAAKNDSPFIFRLMGVPDSATIHIVNLPEGAKVSSPNDAHQGQTNYSVPATRVELVGFFSRHHQAVFTHHDTFLHIHLVTDTKDRMGHLDSIRFQARNMRLFLPAGLLP